MEENKNTPLEEAEAQSVADEQEPQTENAQAQTEQTAPKQDKKKLKKLEEKISELEGQIEKQKSALSEAEDKYTRLYAEYDNFRRRTQKEKEGIYSDAYVDALEQILPILDNLERAAQYSATDSEHPLAKGLELTLKSFAETLEKMGVSEIPALGEQFDPNVHNAVMHVEDDSLGENVVAEVFMKGYIRGDKVLRHSMVKVAN